MRVPDSTARASAEILAGAWADEHHSDIGGGQIFASAASLARAILHLCTAVSAQRCTAHCTEGVSFPVPLRASPCLPVSSPTFPRSSRVVV